MGWVLRTQDRTEALLAALHAGSRCSVTAAESARATAREAYAVALLYLADVHPLALAFYKSVSALEAGLATENVSVDSLVPLASKFRSDLLAIETALAAHPHSP